MKSPSSLGEFEQVILLAILRLDDAYGVSIRQQILAHTKRNVAPGALYTTLDRLEKKGVVSATNGTPTPERGGRAKRFYSVTPEGRRLLVEAQRSFQSLMSGLELLGGHHG